MKMIVCDLLWRWRWMLLLAMGVCALMGLAQKNFALIPMGLFFLGWNVRCGAFKCARLLPLSSQQLATGYWLVVVVITPLLCWGAMIVGAMAHPPVAWACLLGLLLLGISASAFFCLLLEAQFALASRRLCVALSVVTVLLLFGFSLWVMVPRQLLPWQHTAFPPVPMTLACSLLLALSWWNAPLLLGYGRIIKRLSAPAKQRTLFGFGGVSFYLLQQVRGSMSALFCCTVVSAVMAWLNERSVRGDFGSLLTAILISSSLGDISSGNFRALRVLPLSTPHLALLMVSPCVAIGVAVTAYWFLAAQLGIFSLQVLHALSLGVVVAGVKALLVAFEGFSALIPKRALSAAAIMCLSFVFLEETQALPNLRITAGCACFLLASWEMARRLWRPSSYQTGSADFLFPRA